MNIRITRGDQAFTILKSQVQRLLPATAVQPFALTTPTGAAIDCTPVLAQGQPGLVFEPAHYLENIIKPCATAPTLYAVVGQDGDTLLLLAADQISF